MVGFLVSFQLPSHLKRAACWLCAFFLANLDLKNLITWFLENYPIRNYCLYIMDAVKKPFRLISHDRRVQYGVGVESVAEVISKGIDNHSMSWKWSTKTKTLVRFIARTLFNLGIDENVVVVLEEDGTRVTEDGFLLLLESHTKLMILRNNTQWTQQPGTLEEVHQQINIQNGW